MIREPNNRVVTLAIFSEKRPEHSDFLTWIFFFWSLSLYFSHQTPLSNFLFQNVLLESFPLRSYLKVPSILFFFFALMVGYETLLLEIANRSMFQIENAVVRARKRCSGGFSLGKSLGAFFLDFLPQVFLFWWLLFSH